jgi:hypothetical protein
MLLGRKALLEASGGPQRGSGESRYQRESDGTRTYSFNSLAELGQMMGRRQE